MIRTAICSAIILATFISCQKQPAATNNSKTVACFTYTPQNPTSSDNVVFDAGCSKNVTNYFWYVDNLLVNATDSKQTAISEKFSTGSHRISLLVTGTGSNSTDSMSVTVNAVDVKPSTSMSATIGNTFWTASAVFALNSSGIIAIGGDDPDGSAIEIEVPSATVAGTYSVTSSGYNYTVTYSNKATVNSMTNGTIVITSNANKTISGTFSGTLTNAGTGFTVPVSNGSFTATYQ